MSLRLTLCLAAGLMALAALGAGCATAAEPEPIQPIQPAKIKNQAMVDLGAQLFFDPRLSRSGVISCNTCHNLSLGGSDNLRASVGDKWSQGSIKAPTVLNASLNFAQFWDGRAPDLASQAGMTVSDPKEMANSHILMVEVLRGIPGYVTEFKKVFGSDKIEFNQATKAIAAFEETLVTPNARFDKYLRGDKTAITATELEGYNLFKSSKCTDCHNGPAVGGNSYKKMGLVEPYSSTNPAQGRITVTKQEADRFKFKVPSLRNVELRAPYFHDGGALTLTQAVETMGRVQLGRNFTPDENAKIVAFLKTLSGDRPHIMLPLLPVSVDDTPRPAPSFAK